MWGALGGFGFTNKQNARHCIHIVDDVSCFSRGFYVGKYRMSESLAVVLPWPTWQCILWLLWVRAGKRKPPIGLRAQ